MVATKLILPLFLVAFWTACSSEPGLTLPAVDRGHYVQLMPTAIHAITARELVVTGYVQCADGSPEGLVLMSSDGGKAWRRLGFEHVKVTHTRLDCASFSDRLRGWVAGVRVDDQGLTEAVVLRTEDGGSHWRMSVVPVKSAEIVISGVQSLRRDTDSDGVITLTCLDPKTGEARESAFKSSDGGQSWKGLTWLQPSTSPITDFSTSALGAGQAWRLRHAADGESTFVEITANDGKAWLPVSELRLAALSSY
jgi:photosystem II stability/assembly factor-like uncharacterized protein